MINNTITLSADLLLFGAQDLCAQIFTMNEILGHVGGVINPRRMTIPVEYRKRADGRSEKLSAYSFTV
jgi:hypothetical protein